MPANHLRNPCRIQVVLAAQAPRAVILRRGPTEWVQCLVWHTDTDTLEYGQWFHGRIYERRCHVSPDGALFIYFASKLTSASLADPDYTYAWTAVSRPPYLTALALWPKGDCWHGGGVFTGPRQVWLNHPPYQANPHPNHLPRGLDVTPNPLARGEDWPIYSRRLKQDGWTKTQALANEMPGVPSAAEAPLLADYDILNQAVPVVRPETWEKPAPNGDGRRLIFRHYGVDWTRTPKYVETYALAAGDSETLLRAVTWADWDQRGRLVFARRGALYACEAGARPRLVANLNPQAPQRLLPTAWAQTWPRG